MIKDNQSLEEYINEPVAKRQYSITELQNFHDLIQNYYFDYNLSNKEIIRVLDQKKLMYHYGATGPNGGVVLEGIERNEKTGSITYYKRPTRLDQFENLMDQYNKWRSKKGYAEEKKLEELEKMYKSYPQIDSN